MTEDYASKKLRLTRLLNAIEPPSLRSFLPLRHVDAVAGLTEVQRELLWQAIQRAGKINFTKALDLIRNRNDLTLDMLVAGARVARAATRASNEDSAHPAPASAEFLAVVQKCFPGMPAVSVEGVARSEPMADAAALSAALRPALTGNSTRSDFVIVVVYALLTEALADLKQKIREVPAFSRAIRNAGLPWEED